MDLSPPAAPETLAADRPEILAALQGGASVITGNQRAARILRRLFDQQQQAAGVSAWAPPAVLAWESWTRSLSQQLVLAGHATALLLSHTQELALWRAIVAADLELRTLRQPDALAALAANAWSTLHAHGHVGPLTGSAESTDEAAFRRWSATFRARCRRDALFTAAELDAMLERAVIAKNLRLSADALHLVGFDQRSLSQQTLLDAFSRSGVMITEDLPSTPAADLLVAATETPQAELEACAAWMREQLVQRPKARLAIIVPDLHADRAELERVLRDTLSPELHNIEVQSPEPPYEFSLGVPLSSTALVAAALDLLTWSQQPLPSATVSRLLLSRYVAGEHFATERLGRAAFDRGRSPSSLLRPERSLHDVLQQLATNSTDVPGLRSSLHSFRRASEPIQDGVSRSYLDWCEHVRTALDAVGWVPTSESSLEFQIRERWQSTLDELASLDVTGEPVSFARALLDLKRIAAETIFAPESHDASVQVLGPLEAAGSTFDALWLLRCGDLTFPASASSNPLLPSRLRRLFRLPGSYAANDTHRARRLLRRLVASAPRVVVSYARHLDQGSQKLAAIARELTPADLDLASLLTRPDSPPTELIAVAEDPLPAPPDRVLNGGAALLGDQAACGFRAFAYHRLQAKPLDDATFGLDARARGDIVHTIMEHLWAEIRTQADLRALSHEERRSCLNQHIEDALAEWQKAASERWDRAYLDVQRICLASVLEEWLDEELRREPFEVNFREQSHRELAVGPLRLAVRVDRIDHTESGGAVLIDYKTGISKPSQWLSERPDAPQLPLYTLLPEAEQLAAVAFGIVRTGRDLGYTGYESRPGILPEVTKLPAASLAELQQQWRETLVRLALNFYAGDAAVRPKSYPTTCMYCAQRTLCRLDPAALVEGPADEDETEEDATRG